MKFGYFNQLQMPKPWPENAEVQLYKDAMAEAVLAEEVGFEYYWQTEHHFYPEIGHSSAPELFLAALAQHTSKIRLGLGVVVLPCNHPFRVVEYVSTLDVLSGGRVELGTGRGASVYHSEAFGYDAEGAKELWDESIQIIASMFVDDPFPGWKGTHYDLPQRDLVPKPVQKPHPPMWLAATQPATFAKAARMGLGILGFSAIEPEKMIPAIRAYQDAMPECEARRRVCQPQDRSLCHQQRGRRLRGGPGQGLCCGPVVLRGQRRTAPEAPVRQSRGQVLRGGRGRQAAGSAGVGAEPEQRPANRGRDRDRRGLGLDVPGSREVDGARG